MSQKEIVLDAISELPDEVSLQEIAEKIEFLLAHPDKARQMGENGKRTVRERFSLDALVHNTIRMYQELTGRRTHDVLNIAN